MLVICNTILEQIRKWKEFSNIILMCLVKMFVLKNIFDWKLTIPKPYIWYNSNENKLGAINFSFKQV